MGASFLLEYCANAPDDAPRGKGDQTGGQAPLCKMVFVLQKHILRPP
jgi:hypothetical protein